ncbi:uncharacterized protein CC84DRAFT_1185793 [Paraphaeosphaeria sporulosa]|uniref:Methyltransferase type 11 domain-containing protein n=1 Tax=Paraphaeosphaeria sporulosa TaxID=1460663 RepID=A0A177CGT4_9PLEO|nr:uncharacterized protein CC84DRAFT_1185793 [Paraphaeosphaeria sporulosa]OAG06556.1 hypothetical protein CC84DRAFT_1185793 [Paraphaeosphaeria sporulosa]
MGQKPLSDEQYRSAFDVLVQGSKMSYRDFIIPQLSQLLRPLVDAQSSISVLEVGPGPSSIFGHLPDRLRRKIGRYAAFQPNSLFANETYDIVLFCHSMYGMKSKRRVMEHALRMVKNRPQKGLVVVFHRSGSLHFEDPVCHKMAFFGNGVVRVVDDNQDTDVGNPIPADWRQVCRTLGRRGEAYSNHLLFSAPEAMVVLTHDATSLPELTTQVPLADSGTTIKNWMARS